MFAVYHIHDYMCLSNAMAYYKYMYVHLYKMKRSYMHSSLKMLSYSINISVLYRFNFTQKLNYSAS